MAGIVALCTGGVVFIVSLMVASILSRAVEEYEKRYAVKEVKRLTEMFFFITPRQLIFLGFLLMLVLALLGVLLFNWFVGILLGLSGLILPSLIINKLKEIRIRKFNRQLVDALQQMSGAFRAGLTLQQAMENVSRDAPPPLGQEFQLTLREIRLGTPQDEALEALAERVKSEDLYLVVIATNVARQLGGNMAEMYDTIAQTIRERFQMEGKIRALTAQGRLQGWIVALMPLILGFVFNMMRPDLMQPMLHSYFGWGVILLIVILELLGLLFIKRIVSIDI